MSPSGGSFIKAMPAYTSVRHETMIMRNEDSGWGMPRCTRVEVDRVGGGVAGGCEGGISRGIKWYQELLIGIKGY